MASFRAQSIELALPFNVVGEIFWSRSWRKDQVLELGTFRDKSSDLVL